MSNLANAAQIATIKQLGSERDWESSRVETQRYIAVMNAIETGRLDFRAATATITAWGRLGFSAEKKAIPARSEKFTVTRPLHPQRNMPHRRHYAAPQLPAAPLVRDPFTAAAAPADPAIATSMTTLPSTPDGAPEVPAGKYLVDDVAYRVDRPVKGKWAGYTFLVRIDRDERVRNALVRNVILRKILAQGILESTAAYGRETGQCGQCGRTLTNPESIAAGIGPICAGRI